jgi:hypothetical protein
LRISSHKILEGRGVRGEQLPTKSSPGIIIWPSLGKGKEGTAVKANPFAPYIRTIDVLHKLTKTQVYWLDRFNPADVMGLAKTKPNGRLAFGQNEPGFSQPDVSFAGQVVLEKSASEF